MSNHFYNVHAIADETGIDAQGVYRYHRQLRQRELIEPIPGEWPLEKRHAERLINYIQQKKLKRSQTGLKQTSNSRG